jgi:hypothetical protein
MSNAKTRHQLLLMYGFLWIKIKTTKQVSNDLFCQFQTREAHTYSGGAEHK